MKLWIIFRIVLVCVAGQPAPRVELYGAVNEKLCRINAELLEAECRYMSEAEARYEKDLIEGADTLTIEGGAVQCRKAKTGG